MEYTIDHIHKVQIGDTLVLDIDPQTGSFPDAYADLIKSQSIAIRAEMSAYIFLKDLKIRLLFKNGDFKKIGVVVDNYKFSKTKELLAQKGFILLETAPFKGQTTVIKLDVPGDVFKKKQDEVFAIMSLVEAHFKRQN